MSAIGAAWVLSIGFDLFLHAGLLARLYTEPSPFLLEASDAFRRIPLGYAAFLALTLGLYWLLGRLNVLGAASGFRHGLAIGAAGWGVFLVGLYSISTASPSLLIGWWVGQAMELGLAGALLGAVTAGLPLKRAWLIATLAVIGCIVLTVAWQSLGWAPAVRYTVSIAGPM